MTIFHVSLVVREFAFAIFLSTFIGTFIGHAIGFARGKKSAMRSAAPMLDQARSDGKIEGDAMGQRAVCREISTRLLLLIYDAESTRQPISLDVLRKIEREYNRRGNP